MPFPLLALVPVITAGAQALLGLLAVGVAGDFVQRKARAYFDDYSDQFLANAAADMGLELTDDGNLTDESITAVVNNQLLSGSGVQIASLLDRDKLRSGLERSAVQRLAEAAGVPVDGAQTMGGVKAALQAWAGEQVKAQMTAGAGPVIDAATPSPFIARVIAEAPKNDGWNTPTDMTPKGVSNRLRQAKYRRSHKKTWVEK